MKKIIFSIIAFLTIVSLSQAQESQSYTIGQETINYTKTELFEDGVKIKAYYNNDQLVLAETDTDQDGQPDLWILYGSDLTVKKELRDSNGDGAPDIIFEYDNQENLIKAEGQGLDQYQPEISQSDINTSQEESTEDYAGDLENIQKLAGESSGSWFWFIVIIIVIFGLFLWKRSRGK